MSGRPRRGLITPPPPISAAAANYSVGAQNPRAGRPVDHCLGNAIENRACIDDEAAIEALLSPDGRTTMEKKKYDKFFTDFDAEFWCGRRVAYFADDDAVDGVWVRPYINSANYLSPDASYTARAHKSQGRYLVPKELLAPKSTFVEPGPIADLNTDPNTIRAPTP